jgi:hypothetical protein
MNRERAKALLPIIQAFAEGKEVQVKYSSGWGMASDPAFGCDEYKFRIKPEPEVIYVNKWKSGSHDSGIYNTAEYASLVAKEHGDLDEFDYIAKAFIEVIE